MARDIKKEDEDEENTTDYEIVNGRTDDDLTMDIKKEMKNEETSETEMRSKEPERKRLKRVADNKEPDDKVPDQKEAAVIEPEIEPDENEPIETDEEEEELTSEEIDEYRPSMSITNEHVDIMKKLNDQRKKWQEELEEQKRYIEGLKNC